MNLIGALIGALVGGLVGGAVWVGVGYGTGYEVGWIAWGIGLLAGLGAAFGGRGQAGVAGGVLAVAIAIVTILVSKYLVVELIIEKEMRNPAHLAQLVPPSYDREFWVSYIADQLIEERENAGQTVQWPQGVNPDQAMTQAEYPPAIWNDAAARWDAMSPDARAGYCEQARPAVLASITAALDYHKSEIQREGFMQSFSLFDLLWAFLAIGTAFEIGSGESNCRVKQ